MTPEEKELKTFEELVICQQHIKELKKQLSESYFAKIISEKDIEIGKLKSEVAFLEKRLEAKKEHSRCLNNEIYNLKEEITKTRRKYNLPL